MPVVPPPGYEGLAKASFEEEKERTGFSTYKMADENTKLIFLADRFHRIKPVDGEMTLISSYSIGDVLIRIGNEVFDWGFLVMLGFLTILAFKEKKSPPSKVTKNQSIK